MATQGVLTTFIPVMMAAFFPTPSDGMTQRQGRLLGPLCRPRFDHPRPEPERNAIGFSDPIIKVADDLLRLGLGQ